MEKQYYCHSKLEHHGILGQRWGVRRFQNADGSLTPAGQRRLEKRDAKWARKNYTKIEKTAKQRVKGYLDEYASELLNQPGSRNSDGRLSASTINAYNRRMAELMTRAANDITAPSGRVVTFVAKRGEMGVHLALADRGYDMSQLRNGVWNDGRIAYRKEEVNRV